jgi:hypothetical protein
MLHAAVLILFASCYEIGIERLLPVQSLRQTALLNAEVRSLMFRVFAHFFSSWLECEAVLQPDYNLWVSRVYILLLGAEIQKQ